MRLIEKAAGDAEHAAGNAKFTSQALLPELTPAHDIM